MKILLTAVNAKYIHSSLSVRYLKNAAKQYKDDINIKEFTINQYNDFILREIYEVKPDILTFSCYIWNIEQVKELIVDYKKIAPNTVIIVGGPEVSYDSCEVLEQNEDIDIVIKGEGEITFHKLLTVFDGDTDTAKLYSALAEVKGITYRDGNNNIIENGYREAMNLDDLDFPYQGELDEFNNRIIYYETSRGCPFNCQYCLSSIEKGVRFKSLELVYEDLQLFLDAKVKQVKFVDRTFNCNKNHAIGIWNYLKANDNGVTNFHFEISADLLDEEVLQILSDARPKLFQLEIGVQSTNLQTIDYIKRKMSFDKIAYNVKKIKSFNNIHQHLDLIAGLPGEGYNSFKQSFNDVYMLKPEQLQLGFLKVLKGSGLNRDKEKYGLVYKHKAPYEILFTDELSHDEMLQLKIVEEMVENYYNTGRYTNSIIFILNKFNTPFELYEKLAEYWVSNDYHVRQHSKLDYYTILLEFFCTQQVEESDIDSLKELMKLDIYLHEKAKKVPNWMERDIESYKLQIREFYKDEDNIIKYLPKLKAYTSKQISRMAHIEIFKIDIVKWINDNTVEQKTSNILFNYFVETIDDNAKINNIDLDKYNEEIADRLN